MSIPAVIGVAQMSGTFIVDGEISTVFGNLLILGFYDFTVVYCLSYIS